jgi:hypothetical protein
MKQIVKLNWKIADLIREKQSFANWYWNVFKLAPSPKDLKDIKKRERRGGLIITLHYGNG